MIEFDVFISDPREYGGGFEVRVLAADEAEAKAEAIAAANETGLTEAGTSYTVGDVGSVRAVSR